MTGRRSGAGGHTPAGAASVERIVGAATRLFAEQGYAGSRVRDIAAAAGLNVATVAFHVGTKEDLYRLVFERLKQRENAALGEAFAGALARVGEEDADIVAITADLAGSYVEWFAADLHAAPLWVRRWLDDDTPAEAEAREYNLDFYTVAEQVLAAAAKTGRVRAGDHHLALKGFVWMTCGRQIDGLLRTPEQRARYRSFTAEYIRSLLSPDGPRPPGSARG